MLHRIPHVLLIPLDLQEIIAVLIEQGLRQWTRRIDRIAGDQLQQRELLTQLRQMILEHARLVGLLAANRPLPSRSASVRYE